MTSIVETDNGFNITVPKDLITNKMVQKLMSLIRYKELTKDNIYNEEEAKKMANSLQENWWRDNKENFLKDLNK
jgi:hypothetical protein